jgi:hypothetical protein
MKITYRTLANAIAGMAEEEKDQTPTVFDEASGEFLPVTSFVFAEDLPQGGNEVVDDGQAVLVINEED